MYDWGPLGFPVKVTGTLVLKLCCCSVYVMCMSRRFLVMRSRRSSTWSRLLERKFSTMSSSRNAQYTSSTYIEPGRESVTLDGLFLFSDCWRCQFPERYVGISYFPELDSVRSSPVTSLACVVLVRKGI